jgi:hypothetical protein
MTKRFLFFGEKGIGAMLKSHVEQYVKQDGTVVAGHDRVHVPAAVKSLKQAMHPHTDGIDPFWDHTDHQSTYGLGGSKARRAWCEDHLANAGFRPHMSDWSVMKHPDGHVAEMDDHVLRIVHATANPKVD